MLSLLRRADARKLRAFSIGCCRRILHLLPDPRSRRAIEVAERYNAGLATDEELREARDVAYDVDPSGLDEATDALAGLAENVTGEDWEWGGAFESAERAANAVAEATGGTREDQEAAWHAEASAQCELIRSLFTWDEVELARRSQAEAGPSEPSA
jgi:hypothetical protein